MLEPGEVKLPRDKPLAQMANAMALVPNTGKLSHTQVRTQQLIESLKYIENLHPRISLVMHRLSCVMSSPPPEAYVVAQAALAAVYAERHAGITYGGAGMSAGPRFSAAIAAHIDLNEPAPATLEAHADANWGDRNVYAIVLTMGGGCILYVVKKIQLLTMTTMENEAVATGKAAEQVTFAREIQRAMGIKIDGPTLIGTNNLANRIVGSGVGCPSRSKHFLHRYHVLMQRVRAGDVILRHVGDAQMAADFMTKWVNPTKLKMSLRYVCNSWAHPE